MVVRIGLSRTRVGPPTASRLRAGRVGPAPRVRLPKRDGYVCLSARGITLSRFVDGPSVGRARMTGALPRMTPALNEPVDARRDDTLDTLMIRVAGGDKAAFRTLYDGQSPRLYGLAMRLLRQPDAAADAVHDTFIAIWEKARQFDPARGNAAAWIGTMLRYRAIDALRRSTREDLDADIPEVADPDPDALENLARSDDGRALQRCLDLLETHQRKVVTMAFLDGRTHAELARSLAAPLGTVKSWVRRALTALRGCLES